jgi:hypothetical protein
MKAWKVMQIPASSKYLVNSARCFSEIAISAQNSGLDPPNTPARPNVRPAKMVKNHANEKVDEIPSERFDAVNLITQVVLTICFEAVSNAFTSASKLIGLLM